VTLVDDHDVYQGNLWGHEGAHAPNGYGSGGYVNAATWINTVQSVQCGQDPDAYDPAPVQQGITVMYGAFSYRGVSIALVEDRKFKYGPQAVGPDGQPAALSTLPILGTRQESFLGAWASMHPGQPKLLLSQTTWATVKTTVSGGPQSDPDNDAYSQARNRALGLVKAAGAVMVCGDQHLGSTVRHGLQTYTDGPVQFTVPAAGTAWQRWFEANNLPNSQGTPHTGDFRDGSGNRYRVLAVANPLITQAQYVAVYGSKTHNFGDRSLKREGYGVVRIDKRARTYSLEAWPWNADPHDQSAAPYPGWPVVVGFDQA
jgi:alkaline phosphatase D